MNLNAHMTLEGTYSVDVYNRDGTLKYSTKPKKNFITSTGLSMISKFAVADCFRYLSFGTSSQPNTINENAGWGTTYLGQIIPALSYIGGRSVIEDGNHATSRYLSAGFTEHISGVILSRSWKVPYGDEAVFDQDYVFEEVMLSPGRGYEVGISLLPVLNGRVLHVGDGADSMSPNLINVIGEAWEVNQWVGYIVNIIDVNSCIPPQRRRISSNSATQLNFVEAINTSALNPSSCIGGGAEAYSFSIHTIFQLCHCSEYEQSIDIEDKYGVDCSASAYYYSGTAHQDICASSGAFARMVQTISVAEDNYLIFNYDLNVGLETGKYPFKIQVSNDRGVLQNLSLWQGMTGVHQLIHHGLKMISPGTVVSNFPWGPVTQEGYNWSADYDFGESFTGPWGSPLEPSTIGPRLSAYLTNDNLQFFANSVDGGAYSASVAGFSGTSGLMAWRQKPYETPPDSRHFNIRREPTTAAGESIPLWPLPTDYTAETSDPETFYHRIQSMIPSTDASIVYPSFKTPSVRTRTVNRSFEFVGRTNASFSNDSTEGAENEGAQIRGIVLSFIDPALDTNYMFPYLDCLIMDSGVGVVGPKQNYRLLPQKDAPSAGQYTTGNILEVPGSASYWPYLEADAKLTLTFTQTWGSPCAPTVVGC